MKKRISILLLVLCLVLTLLPAAAQASDIVRVGDLSFIVDNGAARLWQCRSTIAGAVNVPESVNGYPVTAIAHQAFASSKVTSVTLPDSVQTVESAAFYGCDSLTSVKLPAGLTSISDDLFSGCTALQSVTLPSGVTSIGSSAFSRCTALKRIAIPDGVTDIGSYAFAYCSGLTDANLPSGLTSISDHLFYECAALKSITIPSGVTSIGKSAFQRCAALTSVAIPGSVKTIDQYAFDSCKGITALTLGRGVQQIGMHAFYGCDLRELTIPSSVTKVDVSAFVQNNNLPYVKDYSSSYSSSAYPYITKVIVMQGWCGEQVEWGLCKGTLHILGTGAMDDYASASGGSQPWELSKKDISGVVVHEGVTSIGNYAFHGSDMKIAEAQLPQSLRRIGDYAFEADTALRSIVLPEGLKTIGRNAFAGTGLVRMTIPASVTELPVSAFDGCKYLQTIWLPGTLTQVGRNAFRDNRSLRDVYYHGVRSQWDAIRFASNNEPLFTATLHCTVPGTVEPFVDVPQSAYYADPVKWAVEKGVTNGTSFDTFSPNNTCTRAQVVTFLWRAAGSPAPKERSYRFLDVLSTQYYYDAVLWATEKGITNGTSYDKFSPNDPCTRARRDVPLARDGRARHERVQPLHGRAAAAVLHRRGALGGGGGRHERHHAHHVQPEQPLHPSADRHVPLPDVQLNRDEKSVVLRHGAFLPPLRAA